MVKKGLKNGKKVKKLKTVKNGKNPTIGSGFIFLKIKENVHYK